MTKHLITDMTFKEIKEYLTDIIENDKFYDLLVKTVDKHGNIYCKKTNTGRKAIIIIFEDEDDT